MNKKQLPVVIILGLLVVAGLVTDVFLYVQGRQEVKRVKVQERETVEDTEYEQQNITDSMDAFTVRTDSSRINAEKLNYEEEQQTTADSSEYIFPNSNSAYLKKSDLKGMSKQELRLARNELYARHGYIFEDETLSAYFSGKSWYSASIEGKDFKDSNVFNKFEIANRDLIVKYENKKN